MFRRTSIFIAVSLIIALVVAAGYAGSGCCPSMDKSKEQKSAAEKAPDFILTNQDGKQISLADLEGKIVVLEWFNYDCPFVKYHYEKMPTMTNLAKKYSPKGVVWLAINSTNYATVENNKAFAEKHSLNHMILDDHTGRVGRAYKAARTPELFIIDKEGAIAYHGAIDNAPLGKLEDGQKEKFNFVDEALDQLTKGEAVSTPQTKPYGCTVKYAK
jgi:peroxiredoxin